MCVKHLRDRKHLARWMLLGFLAVSLGCGAYDAAQQAAQRNVTKDALRGFGLLYQNFLETKKGAPANWEDLQALAQQQGQSQVVDAIRQLSN